MHESVKLVKEAFFRVLVGLFLYYLFILLVAAYLTLFERHLLGLSQNRLGPNKTL